VNALERVGWVVALPILAGGAFLTPRLLTTSLPSSPAQVAASPPAPLQLDVCHAGTADDSQDEEEEAADGFVDLYGNEVTEAIATYTFDQSGSLYELHSPQTALPRLGIPKS
jgi:hypothetical protein